MASIRVTRGGEFLNRWRRYAVYIDGVKVGDLGAKETKDFPVAEGAHTVQAKMDWYTSPECGFTATNGVITYFTVGSSKATHAVFVAALFTIILHRPAGKLLGDAADYCMLGLGVLCVLFLFVVNRRRYLSITKEEGSDYAPPTAISGM